MRFEQQIRACSRPAATAALIVCLFASGRPVSASGQNPAPQQIPTPAQAAVVGAQGPQLQITADEAVKMALENNLGIQGQRLSPQIQALLLSQTRATYAPLLFSNTTKNSTSNPPQHFPGRQRLHHQRGCPEQHGYPAISEMGRGPLLGVDRRLAEHDQRPNRCLQPAPVVELQFELHAAAAAGFLDRQHPPAVADRPEAAGDRGRAAPAEGHADRPRRPDRVLRSARRDRPAGCLAQVAGARQRVAQEQPETRRRRDDSSHRHRRSAGGGVAQRRGGDHQRGADQEPRGRAADAHPEPGSAGLLDRADHAGRPAGADAAGGGRRRRRSGTRSTGAPISCRRASSSSRPTSASGSRRTSGCRGSTRS